MAAGANFCVVNKFGDYYEFDERCENFFVNCDNIDYKLVKAVIPQIYYYCVKLEVI